MLVVRTVVISAIALIVAACTSTYQVWFRGSHGELAALEEQSGHCLSSIGFRDASADEWYAEYLADEPMLVAVWKPTVEGSFFYTPPSAVAWLANTEHGFHVHFQPPNQRGEDAKFLADTFRRCIEYHYPESALEITSQKIVPDLR